MRSSGVLVELRDLKIAMIAMTIKAKKHIVAMKPERAPMESFPGSAVAHAGCSAETKANDKDCGKNSRDLGECAALRRKFVSVFWGEVAVCSSGVFGMNAKIDSLANRNACQFLKYE